MAQATVSLNTKISPQEKETFVRTAEELGMTPSNAIKIFVHMFNEYGGFPFEVRKPNRSATVTKLSPRQFEAFTNALDEPLPPQARELLERDYTWAE